MQPRVRRQTAFCIDCAFEQEYSSVKGADGARQCGGYRTNAAGALQTLENRSC